MFGYNGIRAATVKSSVVLEHQLHYYPTQAYAINFIKARTNYTTRQS